MEIKSRIFFAEESIKKSFEQLKQGKTEERELFNNLEQAFNNLKENSFSGIQIPKRLMPKEYKKYGITNIWKYDLPKGWRLIYSVGKNGIEILSIILEWINHKNYERKFNY